MDFEKAFDEFNLLILFYFLTYLTKIGSSMICSMLCSQGGLPTKCVFVLLLCMCVFVCLCVCLCVYVSVSVTVLCVLLCV